ncbi:hypothetical protein YA49_21800 [Enterobacter cloacae subsp. cloacae]|uniref:DUF6453 family protein n=1 Tax=Enterobacter cloacae TaxID=550 RepID=UPI00063AB1BC|nr:DUF6453 family protein [Enterobacter cloacae]KLG03051.1 hypothetical protein YA49_21800 [Enterobacter cloacae subsp. cloacae]
MPSGLLIDLNDGGKPMEITAGLRCPTYGGAISGGIGNVNTATVEGYVAGSNVIFIPTQTVISDEGIFKLDSVTISGANVTQNWSGNSNPGFPNPQRVAFSGTLWQILPVSQNSNVGLLVQNSTDFTAITTASRVGYCIYKARVTVGTSGWVTPTIAGFDRSKYLVCCKWSSPYTLDYDGNRLLFLNDGSNTEDQPMSGTVDVVIFAGGVSPVAANPGFNIYNAAGQCTFSTARRPFVYLGVNFVPSTTAQTVPGGGYVPVGRFGLRVPSFGGGRIYHYHYGLVMQNGTLRAGRGLYVGWSDRQLANAGVTPISLPVIPDMYV